MRINELVMGKVTPLQLQDQKGLYDPATQSFYFPRFELMSDQTRSKVPVPMKSFILEVIEIDAKNPKKQRFIG